METELALVTGASWALNNLALGSPENVEAFLAAQGVPRMLRIIRSAPVAYVPYPGFPSKRTIAITCGNLVELTRITGRLGPTYLS